jgi:hypothetical protein
MTYEKINRRHVRRIERLLRGAKRIHHCVAPVGSPDPYVPASATVEEVLEAIRNGWAREVVLLDDDLDGRRLIVQRYSTDCYRAVL